MQNIKKQNNNEAWELSSREAQSLESASPASAVDGELDGALDSDPQAEDLSDEYTEAERPSNDLPIDWIAPHIEDLERDARGLDPTQLADLTKRYIQSNLPSVATNLCPFWRKQIMAATSLTQHAMTPLMQDAIASHADISPREVLAWTRRLSQKLADQAKAFSTWLEHHGGAFFTDAESTPYLGWNRRLVKIQNANGFNTIMYELAGMGCTDPSQSKLWKVLKYEANLRAKRLHSVLWMHTDTSQHLIHLHPADSDGYLIRVDRNGLSKVPNIHNASQLLLEPSLNFKHFEAQTLSPHEMKAVGETFSELLINSFACRSEDQLLLACWALSYPLADYCSTRLLMRFGGHTGEGKSSAMKLLTCLFYGQEQLIESTVAANYRLAAQNPLVMLDDIEPENSTKHIEKFLRVSATGNTRIKSQLGDAFATDEMNVRALIGSSSTSELTREELINRNLIVDFDCIRYAKKDWTESAYRNIISNHAELSSFYMTVVSAVLGRIATGHLDTLELQFDGQFGRHSKTRFNRHLAVMYLILEELNRWIPLKKDPVDVLKDWIESQNQIAKTMQAEGEPLLALATELYESAINASNWRVEFRKLGCDRIGYEGDQLNGRAKDFLAAFKALEKRTGIKLTRVSQPNQLGRHIMNARQNLNHAGIAVSRARNAHDDIHEYTFDFTAYRTRKSKPNKPEAKTKARKPIIN